MNSILKGLSILAIAIFIIILGIFLSISIVFLFIGIPLIIIGILLVIISILTMVFGTLGDILYLLKKPFQRKTKIKKEKIIEVKKKDGIYKKV